MKTMPARPQYLRAATSGRPMGVDRENGVLLGYVVAQEGVFKDGRGAFNAQSLSEIVKVGNAVRGGLRSHFTHADLSGDGLGKFLGRAQNLSLGTTVNGAGETVKAVRGDLHFDQSAYKTPNGNLADYVMTLAESDPAAISSSLVIVPREEPQVDGRGNLKLDKDGEPLPALWFPEKLKASDIVSEGAAVDGLLGAEDDADSLVALASQGLDRLFAGQTREVVEARCQEYLNRYLSRRYGEPAKIAAQAPTPNLDSVTARMWAMAELLGKIKK